MNKLGRGLPAPHVLALRDLGEEDHLDPQNPDRLDHRKEDHQKVDLVGHREAVDHLGRRKEGHLDQRKGDHPVRRKEGRLDQRKGDHPDRRKEGLPDPRKVDHPDHRREDRQKADLRGRKKEDHQKEDRPDQKKEDLLVLKEALQTEEAFK